MRDRQSDGIHRLYVMNADGSGAVRLSEGRVGDWPSWAPDSRRVAFAAHYFTAPQRGIWVVNVDGTGLMRVTDDPGDQGPVAWRP